MKTHSSLIAVLPLSSNTIAGALWAGYAHCMAAMEVAA